MRLPAMLLLIPLLAVVSCAPRQVEPTGLVDFDEIPAVWGHLVSVTKHDGSDYYELWFDNAGTGSVTHVPLYRPTWQIKIDRVRTMPRRAADVIPETAGGAS